MRSRAALLGLAVLGIRVPAHVRLDDGDSKARAHAAVQIANRGSAPVVVADAAALAKLVQLSAASLDGPIVCPPVGIAPLLAHLRFPLTLRPARSRRLRYELDFTCGANPGGAPDWTFSATVDDDPAESATTDVRDTRVGTRLELPGPYGVGETAVTLVDASRPTKPNGSFPGAPARTLPTAIWYPTAPDAGGPDAPLAPDGRPFPLVVFAHALGSYNTQSTFLTSHLASHGYVVAAPAFPLMKLGAPGGSTIADVAAQVGDITFVIDSLLASDAGNRFAGGVDPEQIGLAGHSGGALTTLVATYDAHLREPRIKAAVAFAPPACFLQAGYFDAARVPLLIVQGDRDLLVDPAGDAGAAYARAHPPKALVLVHGGTHLGFADVGATLGDGLVCSLFPDRAALNAEIASLLETLGGTADHVGFDGCPSAFCMGDGAHVGGARQLQIGKEAALAFFEDALRGSRTARRYLATLGARDPDVTVSVEFARAGKAVLPR